MIFGFILGAASVASGIAAHKQGKAQAAQQREELARRAKAANLNRLLIEQDRLFASNAFFAQNEDMTKEARFILSSTKASQSGRGFSTDSGSYRQRRFANINRIRENQTRLIKEYAQQDRNLRNEAMFQKEDIGHYQRQGSLVRGPSAAGQFAHGLQALATLKPDLLSRSSPNPRRNRGIFD